MTRSHLLLFTSFLLERDEYKGIGYSGVLQGTTFQHFKPDRGTEQQHFKRLLSLHERKERAGKEG